MGRLDGKVAFITGAARGQGRSHAIRLAQEGADIIAIDACEDQPNIPYAGATEEDLAETVRQVEALDRRIVADKADVRRQAAGGRRRPRGGRARATRHRVGERGHRREATPPADIADEVWSDMLDVNLSGVWRSAKVAIPHIKAGGRGGCIVLTSSAAGLQAYANAAPTSRPSTASSASCARSHSSSRPT